MLNQLIRLLIASLYDEQFYNLRQVIITKGVQINFWNKSVKAFIVIIIIVIFNDCRKQDIAVILAHLRHCNHAGDEFNDIQLFLRIFYKFIAKSKSYMDKSSVHFKTFSNYIFIVKHLCQLIFCWIYVSSSVVVHQNNGGILRVYPHICNTWTDTVFLFTVTFLMSDNNTTYGRFMTLHKICIIYLRNLPCILVVNHLRSYDMLINCCKKSIDMPRHELPVHKQFHLWKIGIIYLDILSSVGDYIGIQITFLAIIQTVIISKIH